MKDLCTTELVKVIEPLCNVITTIEGPLHNGTSNHHKTFMQRNTNYLRTTAQRN